MKRSRLSFLSVLSALLILGACTTTQPTHHEAYQKPIQPGAEILLMKPDIECSALGPSGIPEPNAAWTAQAERHVEAALRDLLQENQSSIITYDETALTPERLARFRELSRLYEVVGVSMMVRDAIPTAKNKTNWTLGPGVRELGEGFDADYVLFIFLRDQYETAARIGTRVTAAMLGVAMAAPVQQGSAALVDLETGDVVWFNRLFSTTGDLRSYSGALESVKKLLDECPAVS